MILIYLLLLLMIDSILSEWVLSIDPTKSNYAVYPETTSYHVYQILYYPEEDWEAQVASRQRPEFGPTVEGTCSHDWKDEPT